MTQARSETTIVGWRHALPLKYVHEAHTHAVNFRNAYVRQLCEKLAVSSRSASCSSEAVALLRRSCAVQCEGDRVRVKAYDVGKRDSIHLLEVIFETATVPELRQQLLYTTPSGWWRWCIESVFRDMLMYLSRAVPRRTMSIFSMSKWNRLSCRFSTGGNLGPELISVSLPVSPAAFTGILQRIFSGIFQWCFIVVRSGV